MLFEDRISLILKLIETQGSIENSKNYQRFKNQWGNIKKGLSLSWKGK